MTRSFLFFLFACIAFADKSFAQYQLPGDVLICDENTPAPANCRMIEDINVPSSFMRTACTKEQVIQAGKQLARKKGGNVLKIDELRKIGVFKNGCWEMEAHVYYMADTVRLQKLIAAAIERMPKDTVTAKLIADTASYALLYVYRPMSLKGIGLPYAVHVNEEEICTVGAKSCHKIKYYEEGPAKIWGTIEKRAEERLNIKFGKAYFIRCEVGDGVWVGRPLITVMDPNKGYTEYMEIKKTKKREEKVND